MKVWIEPKENDEKSRRFEFEVVGYLSDRSLMPDGASDVTRPLFLVAAVDHASMTPVRANLMLGRKFGNKTGRRSYSTDRFELLKSEGYRFETQKHAEGSFLTAYLPTPFAMDPGFVDPQSISFVILPTQTWLAECASTRQKEIEAAREYVQPYIKDADFDASFVAQISPLFGVYLDRRTRVPLMHDLRFYSRLMVELHKSEHLRVATRFERTLKSSLGELGYGQAVSMRMEHEAFETVAAKVTKDFLKETNDRRTRRVRA